MHSSRPLLERTLAHAADFLDDIDDRPVGARVDLATLRRRLHIILGEEGIPAEQVIDDLVAATEGGHLGSAGGRFFAWVIGGCPSVRLGSRLADLRLG